MMLTVEQVLGLANDANLMRSSRVLAVPEKWETLGRGSDIVWGTFRAPSRDPFHVGVHIRTCAMTCDCRNRQVPCNHTLALLLLAVEQLNSIPETDTPEWAQSVAHIADLPVRNADQGKQQSTRLKSVRRGLIEMEVWLHDLVRGGLAELPKLPTEDWQAVSARLVDARCSQLAEAVREWPVLLKAQPNWAETLLREMGKMQLLIEAYRRFETFSAETQNDLRTAVGWWPIANPNDRIIADRWLVLGRQVRKTGRANVQHIWLWGINSGQPAYVVDAMPTRKQPRQQYLVGMSFSAEIRLLASQSPLYAQFESAPHTYQQATSFVTKLTTISQLQTAYSQMQVQNFWLGDYPFALHNTQAIHVDNRWQLVDESGMLLPLPPNFAFGWHLQALSGAPLCGVWNGHTFSPQAVWHGERVLTLRLLSEVR